MPGRRTFISKKGGRVSSPLFSLRASVVFPDPTLDGGARIVDPFRVHLQLSQLGNFLEQV